MRGVIYIFVTLLAYAHGIRFFLEPNAFKCLKEEVQANVLVAGEYEVSVIPAVKTEYIVNHQFSIIFIFLSVYCIQKLC